MRILPDRIINKSIEIAKIPKIIDSVISWKDESGNKNYKKTNFAVVKEKKTKTTIPNLFFMAAYRESRIIGECEYSFGLFYAEDKIRFPILQLEVYGSHQQSHRSNEFNEIFFGSHLHFSGTQIEVKNELGCHDFQQWINLYCYISKIELKTIIEHPVPAQRLPL